MEGEELQLCHPDALLNANMKEVEEALGYECQHPYKPYAGVSRPE